MTTVDPQGVRLVDGLLSELAAELDGERGLALLEADPLAVGHGLAEYAAASAALADIEHAIRAVGPYEDRRELALRIFARLLVCVHDGFEVQGGVVVDGRPLIAVPDADALDRRRPVAPASAPGASPSLGEASINVAVTRFGEQPAPYLARLEHGEAIAITKRLAVVLEVHPIDERRLSASGLMDHAWRTPSDLTMTDLQGNPSGVIKQLAGGTSFAVLRRHNEVVGLVVPAGHPFLAARHAGFAAPAPLDLDAVEG